MVPVSRATADLTNEKAGNASLALIDIDRHVATEGAQWRGLWLPGTAMRKELALLAWRGRSELGFMATEPSASVDCAFPTPARTGRSQEQPIFPTPARSKITAVDAKQRDRESDMFDIPSPGRVEHFSRFRQKRSSVLSAPHLHHDRRPTRAHSPGPEPIEHRRVLCAKGAYGGVMRIDMGELS